MADKYDKQLNLGKFVFDEENHERKSWKFLDVRAIDLFYFIWKFFVRVLILACAIVRIMLSTTYEEKTIWVAFLSSTVGYILLSPKL